ncbi:MAG TPA: YafY family protein [Bryobacteraceae bacterium]|nr:YafY family protein [Bryobacteraceae bacterium]
MLDTSARLLRLLSLFQARRYWSGAELSGRLEVTARTLRRDVDRLRSLGYPVNSTSGIAGGYQLGSGATLPPLLLDDEEAVAVVLGLRTAASGMVSGIEEASVRALAKLEQVLPSRLRGHVAALGSSIVPLPHAGPKVDARLLAALAAACRDSRILRFQYQSREGTSSLRETEPHRLVHTGHRWYLAAWDVNRNNWRTFRVDRIDGRPSAGARFTPRKAPEGDFAVYVRRSIAAAPYPYQAKLKLYVSISAAAQRIPPAAAILEEIDEGSCMLHLGAGSLEGLCLYLGMLGFEFEVLEPPELVECIRGLIGRFGRAVAPND